MGKLRLTGGQWHPQGQTANWGARMKLIRRQLNPNPPLFMAPCLKSKIIRKSGVEGGGKVKGRGGERSGEEGKRGGGEGR